MNGSAIAVLVPCRNEAFTVARVVADFQAALPNATIYVYDNASTDATAEVAKHAGAVVRFERRPGKGGVVRRMFADVEADIYVLVDGDATYDAASAPLMVQRLVDGRLDMVTAVRRDAGHERPYPPGHRFGNHAFNALLGALFGQRPADLLSGYRVLSRRFVKSFPAVSQGFEIETEMTVHALELRLPMAEVPTTYRERPSGSASKLRTYHDGIRILRVIMILMKQEKPLTFFGVIGALLAILSGALAVPVIETYLKTGLVPRLPTAVLSTGIMLLAFLSFFCGLILETVTRGRVETKRLSYLSVPIRFNSVATQEAQAPWRTGSDG